MPIALTHGVERDRQLSGCSGCWHTRRDTWKVHVHSTTFSADTLHTAGVLLLTVVAIEYGGTYILRLVRGSIPTTDFQMRFSRAGHAHAGVLVLLSLIALPYADATHLTGIWDVIARNGTWLAAILMPAGFFVSSAGRNVQGPNRFVVLIYLGALCLAAGVVTLGVGLVSA